jgi:hypothetical protein
MIVSRAIAFGRIDGSKCYRTGAWQNCIPKRQQGALQWHQSEIDTAGL